MLSRSSFSWLLIATITLSQVGLSFSPTLAQELPAPSPAQPPAELIFTSEKAALEIPFNTNEPSLSTTALSAVVRDGAGQPVEGAQVAFSSGNAWFPDSNGELTDYDFVLTNATGLATTTYSTSNGEVEDWVDLHATVVVDPKAPIESRQILHRRIQIALNNPEDFTNRAIDAAAEGEANVQESAASNEERLQEMASEVSGQNTVKIEMDAELDPTNNQQSPPASFAAMSIQVRAVASRAVLVGSSMSPPNLGRVRLEFDLASSDDHQSPASLKQTADNIFLNFQQTSSGGSGEEGTSHLTWAGSKAASNALYLNPRAWGERELTVNVRLIAERPIDGDLLESSGFASAGDDSYLLAEDSFVFNQQNPTQPELKLELQANPTELAAGDRALTITGRLSADDQAQWGEVEAQVSSSDGEGEQIDTGAKLTNANGEFSIRYTPTRDDKARDLTFTITANAVEGPNREAITEIDPVQASIVVKQKESITTADDELDEPQPVPDERILLGEGEASGHTVKIYGNQPKVVTSGFFEGFNLALDNTVRRGTTINDLGAIAGYRYGPQSFMKITVEVTTPEGGGAQAAGDQLTGRVFGITSAETFRNYKSYLLAAEAAPSTYYFERPNTDRGSINVALDEDGKAVYYFAAGEARVTPDQTRNIAVDFTYRGRIIQATIPVIRQIDLQDNADGPSIEFSPRILEQVPTAEREAWPPAVKESLDQAENKNDFLRKTWEVVATVAPPKDKTLDSKELLLKSDRLVRYLAVNGTPILQTETELVATLTSSNKATIYLQLVGEETVQFIARHSLANQIYEKTLRLAPSGEVNPPDGEGDGGEGEEGGDGSGDGEGEEGEEGGEQGPTKPIKLDNNLTDSTLGVKLGLTADLSNIGVGERIQIPVTVDVPSDVKLPERGRLLTPAAFLLKPYHLEGNGKVVFVSINQISGQQRSYNLAGGSNDGIGIEHPVNPQTKKFKLGYFELTKGESQTDRVGVNLFYTFLERHDDRKIPKEIRSWGEIFESGHTVHEKKIGVDLVMGLATNAPAVQPLGTESVTAMGEGEDDPESPYSFDFAQDKPLSPMTVTQAVNTAKAVFAASDGLSGNDKESAEAILDNLLPTVNLFNMRTFVPRLELVAKRALGANEQAKLLTATANMVADMCNAIARFQGAQLSGAQQRFIDQAVAEIKSANYNAIDDLRKEAGLREYGEFIGDSFEEVGVYTKRPIAGNPLGLGTSFAGTDAPESNAVGILDLIGIWFNSLFNRN